MGADMISEEEEEARTERREWWAIEMTDGVGFWRIVRALDILGWQIVPQGPEPSDRRFPVLELAPRRWPAWIDTSGCEDSKPKPQLQLIEGGRQDDLSPSS
jgi:hypothetical protein